MAKRTLRVHIPMRLQDEGIDCTLTVYKTFAQADVIDYRGGRPSKYDTEDALHAAKQTLRAKYPRRAGPGMFHHHASHGEVSSWRIEMLTPAQSRRVYGTASRVKRHR